MLRLPVILTVWSLSACTAVPAHVRGPAAVGAHDGVPENAVPDFCTTAFEAGPTYSQADISARIVERNAALPEGAPMSPPASLARPAPQYPLCALSSDLEGHCDMVFDVLADGTTANILPVCTSRVFERDAVTAVRGWTFEPPVEGLRPAILNRLTFSLDDSDAAPAPPPLAEPGPATN